MFRYNYNIVLTTDKPVFDRKCEKRFIGYKDILNQKIDQDSFTDSFSLLCSF